VSELIRRPFDEVTRDRCGAALPIGERMTLFRLDLRA